jgi:hypothetical protein
MPKKARWLCSCSHSNTKENSRPLGGAAASEALNGLADETYRRSSLRAKVVCVAHPAEASIDSVEITPRGCAIVRYDKRNPSRNRIRIDDAQATLRDEPTVLIFPMKVTVLRTDLFEVGLDAPADKMTRVVIDAVRIPFVLEVEAVIGQFPHYLSNLPK